MTAGDVVQPLREQNVQVSGGAIGAPPMNAGNAFQYTVTTQGRFEDARHFRYVIVKSTDDGRLDRAFRTLPASSSAPRTTSPIPT